MKRFVMIVLVCAALVGGVILLKKQSPTSNAQATNHTKGAGTTGVTLVEYGDFQCPGCGAFYPIVTQVLEEYKDQIKFQFVNFPLTQIHLNALAAARSAQAASNQNKFWEMYNQLYTNQTSWSESTNAATIFESYATQLGLDMTKYRKDFSSSETNAIINADIAKGQALKVTGTPTFYLDGKQITDNNTISTLEKFKAAIDAAIKAKTGKAPASSATQATTPAETSAETPASTEGDAAANQ